MILEIEGLVLKQTQYKEKDAMVSVLTKTGIVNFSARGIISPTSKNASSCLLFAKSIFTLSSKQNRFSLTQGKLIDSHFKIYESLEAMSATQLVVEAIAKFIDEEENDLYFYLDEFLKNIENGFDSLTLACIMLAQIIKRTGYELDYSNCVLCGNKKNIVSIDYNSGGFICYDCAKKMNLASMDTLYLNSFRYCFMVTPDKMNHYTLDKLISNRLINDFSTYLCDKFGVKELKSFDLYKKSLE